MNENTMEKMSQMRLYGMLRHFRTLVESTQYDSMGNDQVLAALLQAEWEEREHNKTMRCLKQARFRYQASIEEIDWQAARGLDKNQLLRMADCSFVDRKESILVTGPTGVGKSYIVSALGHQACFKGYTTKYYNAQKLFASLRMAQADGSLLKEINKIERMDLLIIDDFGLQPLDHQDRMALLEIIEDRHNRRATVIASQIPVKNWYDVIQESTVADAILDRLVHGAHRLNLGGESMRKKTATKINP